MGILSSKMKKCFETPRKQAIFESFQAKFANLQKIKVVLEETYISETSLLQYRIRSGQVISRDSQLGGQKWPSRPHKSWTFRPSAKNAKTSNFKSSPRDELYSRNLIYTVLKSVRSNNLPGSIAGRLKSTKTHWLSRIREPLVACHGAFWESGSSTLSKKNFLLTADSIQEPRAPRNGGVGTREDRDGCKTKFMWRKQRILFLSFLHAQSGPAHSR